MKREPICFGLLRFFFVIVVVSNIMPLGGVTAEKSNLYFGVFISQESDFDFSGFIPPLEWGVDTINNDTSILEDYYIEYKPITNGKVK